MSPDFTERRGAVRKRPIDETDRRIIAALRADPQASNRDVARIVEVSEMTVSNRIEALIEDTLMKITVQRDVRTLGSQCLAHVELDVDGDKVEQIATALGEFEQVFAVSVVIGNPQIVMLVFARNNQDLQRFVQEDLAKVEGIRQASVSLALQTIKADMGIAAL